MHLEFEFIAEFLCMRVIRIFAFFFVQQSAVRPSHKLHSIAANYHMNSMQPFPVPLPPPPPLLLLTEIHKAGCVSMELLNLTSLEALHRESELLVSAE
jgi:hypothetical protein